jgi:hypothetical protein
MATRPQTADIIIGGKLPAALLEEFLGKIGSSQSKFGTETTEQLRQVLNENGHLLLMADKVDELAGFCVQHGIPFDRRNAAGIICFRPGMTSPMLVETRCEALLDASNIRPIAKELAGLVTAKLTREKVLSVTVKVIRHLNSLLPPEIEPLPRLEIEE